MLSQERLEELRANSLTLQDAKTVRDFVTEDATVGGIFPNVTDDNLGDPNVERFKEKYCSWWPIARILLSIAKIFTNEKVDKIIDGLLALGDEHCA